MGLPIAVPCGDIDESHEHRRQARAVFLPHASLRVDDAPGRRERSKGRGKPIPGSADSADVARGSTRGPHTLLVGARQRPPDAWTVVKSSTDVRCPLAAADRKASRTTAAGRSSQPRDRDEPRDAAASKRVAREPRSCCRGRVRVTARGSREPCRSAARMRAHPDSKYARPRRGSHTHARCGCGQGDVPRS